MKRRNFVKTGTAGALGMGLAGCSSIKVKQKLSSVDFDRKAPRPKGTMPMGEIGKTGIKASKFGFGSHMRGELQQYPKEREWMIREAYDMGMNFFDVYDKEQNCFQYEPMGRYLAPMINNVVISISMYPYDGRSFDKEFERDLRVFGRDYIDMVRIHAWTKDVSHPFQQGHKWEWWDKLFKLKEKGYIRAVGVPIHRAKEAELVLSEYPLDYVIFPFNYYHNWTWYGNEKREKKYGTYNDFVKKLLDNGVGIVSMKPFASDSLITPFKELGKKFDSTEKVNVAKASLRYVLNSEMNIDATIGGMYYPYQLYENLDAVFNPAMSDQERNVLKKIRNKAKVVAKSLLPSHYQFLEDWVPDSCDDSDLFGTA